MHVIIITSTKNKSINAIGESISMTHPIIANLFSDNIVNADITKNKTAATLCMTVNS